MYSYCIHGLNLRSVLTLKESQDSFLSADVLIHKSNQRPSLELPLQSHVLKSSDHQERALVCKYQDGGLSIDYFDCGFFYYKHKLLLVHCEHPDQEFFEAILTTQILPLVSSLFHVTLHGGIVVKNQKAVIYLGPEGAGKSTLTTYLSQKGFALWSDDVAAIQSNLSVFPGLPEIRINKDSAHFLLSSQQIKNLKQKLTKQQIFIPPSLSKNAEVAAIFILQPQNDPSFKCTPLTGVQRLPVLIENQFRFDIWNSDILQSEFNTLTSLCQRIPLWQLQYPFEYESLEWVEQQIERSFYEPQQNPHCF